MRHIFAKSANIKDGFWASEIHLFQSDTIPDATYTPSSISDVAAQRSIIQFSDMCVEFLSSHSIFCLLIIGASIQNEVYCEHKHCRDTILETVTTATVIGSVKIPRPPHINILVTFKLILSPPLKETLSNKRKVKSSNNVTVILKNKLIPIQIIKINKLKKINYCKTNK